MSYYLDTVLRKLLSTCVDSDRIKQMTRILQTDVSVRIKGYTLLMFVLSIDPDQPVNPHFSHITYNKRLKSYYQHIYIF